MSVRRWVGPTRRARPGLAAVILAGVLGSGGSAAAQAPEAASDDTREFRVYGFVMMDAGYDFNQVDPDWFDVVRPTKLPSFPNEHGTDGNMYFSVRQTRFGVDTRTPTELGDLTTIFEFELFGVGPDAGQTTFRLRHAYGEVGAFGAGQYWSPFMDIDVFPNSLEYWGPPGMVFFRNIQFRWMPLKGESRITVAAERPGASGDRGRFFQVLPLDDVEARFPMPDISGEFRFGRDWGYVEIAGIYRRIQWEDLGTDAFQLDGSANGWGVNLSSNLRVGENGVVKLQLVNGEAIENYLNDASIDIGVVPDLADPVAPLKGVALPVLGARRLLRPHLERPFCQLVRLLPPPHRQRDRPAGRRLPPGGLCSRQSSLLSGVRRDARGAVAIRAARELS